jgi:UDP-4-amino-4,6-dideoxy-N-acetyl-beta-L-altrosamine N-acetyltransferase
MCKNYKIKNFINLSYEDKIKVLIWRNHLETSKWMIKKFISIKEHLNFINSLKKIQNKKYFLLDDIGVVYFIIKDNLVEIGLYKNPNKKKVGTKLMEFALNYAFEILKAKKIVLFVYENNKKAINLYKKFGFKTVDKKDNLIKMELKYENRKN